MRKTLGLAALGAVLAAGLSLVGGTATAVTVCLNVLSVSVVVAMVRSILSTSELYTPRGINGVAARNVPDPDRHARWGIPSGALEYRRPE